MVVAIPPSMSTAVGPAERAKPATAKKSAGVPKKPSGHPPFAEMINEAIVVLKERNGSSQVAIQKFIEEKYKHLPTTFRKILLVQLKRMVTSGKLVRVKYSFKLAPSSKPAATKPKPKAKESAEAAKPKSKGGVAVKEKKSDSSGTKKRKVAEKLEGKAKPVTAVKAARTSKKITSPGKKALKKTVAKPMKTASLRKVKSPVKKTVAKPKTASLRKVKSPVKKATPKRVKSVKAAKK